MISVIIPVYNVEQYLRQCVDSVLAQSYTNYEILLVDDGSADNSGEICREYATEYDFVYYFRKENGGASSARNYGLDRAKGKYVYFLDSDDLLSSNALEKMIICAEKESADLVFIEAQTLDEKGILSTGQYDYHHQYQPGYPFFLMEEMIANKEFHVGTPFFFIRKDVFDRNQLRFKEGIMYEDMIMSYQLFSLAKRGAHIHEYLYTRRYRASSVMTSAKTERNYISAATAYREVAAFMETLPDNMQSPKHIIRCAFNVLNIYRQMPSNIQKKYKDDYKDIIQDILEKDAFGDTALKLDCKSHLLWGAYKLKQKIIK